MIKLGKYRHFKGHEVKVIGIAKHSETLEDYVIYECYRENTISDLWIRTVKMFEEEVERDGKIIKRFTKIED